MTKLYHAVVWIDHQLARVFQFNRVEVHRTLVKPDDLSRHLHHKANSIGSGKAAVDHHYLQRVAEELSGAQAIFIIGPANEKVELVKHIEAHMPGMSTCISAVQSCGALTDKQVVDLARSHFSWDHQTPIR